VRSLNHRSIGIVVQLARFTQCQWVYAGKCSRVTSLIASVAHNLKQESDAHYKELKSNKDDLREALKVANDNLREAMRLTLRKAPPAECLFVTG
jgi:hypothetical protein